MFYEYCQRLTDNSDAEMYRGEDVRKLKLFFSLVLLRTQKKYVPANVISVDV